MSYNITDTDYQRFWSKVKIPQDYINDCWIYQGGTNQDGYAAFQVKVSLKGHKISYIYYHNKIVPPKGMCVCHNCDNPICVNPNHLFLGTHQDNMDDRSRKGRTHRHIGETNGRAKLVEQEVIDIRKLYDSKKFSVMDLSKMYGLGWTAMDHLVKRKTWKHI